MSIAGNICSVPIHRKMQCKPVVQATLTKADAEQQNAEE
jgi:hypothetical protein